ncbi:MAG TPA: alkaline phosphatase family protein [Caulobacteraceae bacterium]|jgi:hypothetical protein|nr:alkaline phosphatase family protein [Caulobacteraceae bacterium]
MFKRLTLATTAALLIVAPSAHATIGDVFYIDLENHNATQPSSYTGTQAIYGNPAAPFINSLITPGNPNAQYVSYATHYNNVVATTLAPSVGNPTGSTIPAQTVHPSEPNYLWQEAGATDEVGNDNAPYTAGNIQTTPNLSGLLQAKGISWKSYQEDTDLLNTSGQNFNGAGGTITSNVAAASQYEVPLTNFSGASAAYTNPYNGSDQYNFATKHDGQLFFTDTNGGDNPTSSNVEASHYAPLQQLSTDLANNTVGAYNLITPDQYNDMHTALSTNFTYDGVTYLAGTDAEQIALGDNFLSKIVPLIEASKAFQNNGEIVIWNDEDEGDTAATDSQFSGVEIVISKLAKGNAYTNDVSFNHSSDLLTLQEIFGLTGTPLGGAAGATSLQSLYQAGAIPEPGTWALMLMGIGGLGAGLRIARRKQMAAIA